MQQRASTANVKTALLAAETKQVTTPGRFFSWLNRAPAQKLAFCQNASNTIRETLGAWYGMSNLITSVVNAATSVGMPKVPYGVFKSVAGASYGAAALTLYHAIRFGRADAEAHAVSNKQIDRSVASKPRESSDDSERKATIQDGPYTAVEQTTTEEKGCCSGSDKNVVVTFPPDEAGKDPITVVLTPRQWQVTKDHYYNDVFKDISDYMFFVNTAEAVLTYFNAIPDYPQDDWVRPVAKMTLNVGFFAFVSFARALDLKSTAIALAGETEEEAAEKRLYQTV